MNKALLLLKSMYCDEESFFTPNLTIFLVKPYTSRRRDFYLSFSYMCDECAKRNCWNRRSLPHLAVCVKT